MNRTTIPAHRPHLLVRPFDTVNFSLAIQILRRIYEWVPFSVDTGFGVSGPSALHSPFDSAYPHGDFKSAIAYPGGYLKEYSPYSKRAAPSQNEDGDKETIKVRT